MQGFHHLSDRDLIMSADGELSSRRRAQAAAHLASCWTCRERMRSLEQTIGEIVRARNADLNQTPFAAAASRALLRARLSEAAAIPAPRLRRLQWLPAAAAASLLLLVSVLIFDSRMNAEGPLPRVALTPGETRPISLEEVCRYQNAEVVSHDIPEDKRRQVFAIYGIRTTRADQFEVDYLITPDLGGAESLRNLWPQPYSARWNARVKDKLEERLHQLVCSRQLDLATAQHAVASDWIAAYRKYMGHDQKQ